MKIKVGVVGSRRRKDREFVESVVAHLPRDIIIVSGACEGPDSWAVDKAKELDIEFKEFPPNLPAKDAPYYEFVKSYYTRNEQIAQYCDFLIAFVASDRTGGTENTIKHALKLDKQVILMKPNRQVEVL